MTVGRTQAKMFRHMKYVMLISCLATVNDDNSEAAVEYLLLTAGINNLVLVVTYVN